MSIVSGKVVVVQLVMRAPVGVSDDAAMAMAMAGFSVASHLLPFVMNVTPQVVADSALQVKPNLSVS